MREEAGQKRGILYSNGSGLINCGIAVVNLLMDVIYWRSCQSWIKHNHFESFWSFNCFLNIAWSEDGFLFNVASEIMLKSRVCYQIAFTPQTLLTGVQYEAGPDLPYHTVLVWLLSPHKWSVDSIHTSPKQPSPIRKISSGSFFTVSKQVSCESSPLSAFKVHLDGCKCQMINVTFTH